jgi:hypothetical protein
MSKKDHYTCVSYSRGKAKSGCQMTIRARRGDKTTLREAGWERSGSVSDMWKCPACKESTQKDTTPVPVIGQTLHYFVPFVGWRPMTVTSVGGPTKWAVGDGENSLYVNGWAKLDPEDGYKKALMEKLSDHLGRDVVVRNEYPVVHGLEGEDFENWRWPPKV